MKWVLIILLIFVLSRIVSNIIKKNMNKKAIGKRFMIHYFDQNIHFDKTPPLKGLINKQIRVGKKKHFILELDEFLAYDYGNFKQLCISERHLWSYIGSNKSVHVHVFLPKISLNKNEYKLNEFNHVAWAEITPI